MSVFELDAPVLNTEANWPASCPVVHMDVDNDFLLQAKGRFVRQAFVFWIWIILCTVLDVGTRFFIVVRAL